MASLPTDPVGTFTLTLTNLIDGSAIQVEDALGTTTFHNSIASGTSKVISRMRSFNPALARGAELIL